MQVIKLTTDFATAHCSALPKQTDEKLQREYDFLVAEKLTKKMLENGLITNDECTRILAENRRYFSPILAKILPN